MTEPPQRRGGRRRLREPEEELPQPSRPSAEPRSTGAHALPPRSRSRHAEPEPEYDPEPPSGGRRRLRPPERLRPVEDLDPQPRRAPERAARARHGLDEAAEHAPPPNRRHAPEEYPPGHPARRRPQPGDRSVGMPTAITEPTRRTRRVEPPTDVLPAQAPPPPPPPPPVRSEPARPEPQHEEPVEEEFFGEDEYDDYDGEYDYEDYDESEFDEEHYEEAEEEPEKPRRKKRGKRFFGWVAALAVIGLLAGGAWYGFNALFGYKDFEGSGDNDVLFQIDDGDTTSAIGAKLASAGIVGSGKAFVKAGENNPAVSKLQHGYYVMKQHMSGAAAVQKITAQDSRVGQLEVRAYTQFDDITQPDGKVTPGVFSLLSKASCADLNGKSTCLSVEDLRKAVENADLKQLGVPDWAIEPANKADPKSRRLEGLIAPGVYDVKPGSTANELLGQLVKTSADAIQAAGLNGQTAGPGMTPYQTLIIASMIEREAVKADFGKISRVIYNRLDKNMRLQLDSTVNYVLDRPTLLTNDEDRTKAGAYNTYKNTGLTPTPISVPSPEAIKAALNPTPGDFLFFVKCESNGLSCFATTLEEHNKNVSTARAKGVI